MYDFIVVGAGTAGCVLADRLTAAGKSNVLLVEAGGRPSRPFVAMPAGFAKLFRTRVDWAFQSEPQTHAGDRRIFTPRGKMLGGSSNMNAQIHQWCHPADFDAWNSDGAPGWAWSDVSPVLLAQEQWAGSDTSYPRGHTGPMRVSPNHHHQPLSHAFVKAAHACGLHGPDDYNGGPYQGAWICQLAHHNGTRFSAYNAFLLPALQRPNLETITDAHVTRIDVEEHRAAGITVMRNGQLQSFRASRGVVLCAGAFGSPQILMLSGIGPAQSLQTLGIPVLVDAPGVGQSLQDHPLVPVVVRSRGTDTMKSAESPVQLLRYFLFRKGMLASNGVEAFAFTRVGTSAPAPDLEIIFVPLEWRDQGLQPPQIHAFALGSVAVAPKSRGSVWLRSRDPLAPPAIDFGLLSDPAGEDAAILLAGVRLIRQIVATPPLAPFQDAEVFPGKHSANDSELLAQLCTQLQTVYHPTSTCRIGSVVDPQLRVRGVDRLWVADASVMPSVPRGHPNAVVAMIAERASLWMQSA